MITKVTFSQAHDLLQRAPDALILDVREEPEYLTGHAVDALLLPVDEITAETAAELIPSLQTPVLVYCRSGRRSRRAARLLDALGYENLYDMGGLVGWPYWLE